MEKIIKYEFCDRDWKGGQVVAIIKDKKGKETTYSNKVKDELKQSLYLCVAFFGSKPTAQKMAEDLNSGKITLSQAIDKVLKSTARWQANLGKRRGIVPRPGISKLQLKYFGATKEQLQEFDRLEKELEDYVSTKSSRK